MGFRRALSALSVIIAGAILPWAFAPVRAWFLAPLSLAFLWWEWRGATPLQALWRGWLWGFGFFGVGVSWVEVSLRRFGFLPLWESCAVAALFCGVLALFPAILGYLTQKFYRRDDSIKALILLPFGFVLTEWIRGVWLSGFPWLFLGYSQTDSPLRGLAPIVGVLGVSYCVGLTAGLLLITVCHFRGVSVHSRRKSGNLDFRLWGLIGLFLLYGVGEGLSHHFWTHPVGPVMRVSLVQGAIPESVKWDPAQAQMIFERYRALTAAISSTDFLIWPEAAIPVPFPYSRPWVDALQREGRRGRRTLITGIPVAGAEGRFYNSAFILGEEGEIQQYDKRHLVPFGEFIPWRKAMVNFFKALDIPMSDLIPGEAAPGHLSVRGVPVALLICYEIAYSSLVLQSLPEAQLLIVLTDNAWFGHSLAAEQQLQIAQMRSLETGRYTLCSANDGVTAVIDPRGRLVARLPRFNRGVLTAEVQPMEGNTPLVALFRKYPAPLSPDRLPAF